MATRVKDRIKTFSAPDGIKAIDAKARTIEHTISAQTVDRDGEVLRSRGVKADVYLRNNPVVLWQHSERFARGAEHELPIGKCLDVSVSDTSVTALTKFAGLDEAHPFAERVFRLYSSGFLNSWSVGFSTLKESRDKLLATQTGRSVLEWELLEYSAVALPSNSAAITQFMKSLSLPDGATEDDLGKALGVIPLAKYWSIAEQILPAESVDVKAMPAPKPSESQDDFVTRCMGNPVMNADYPEQAQRAAVCHAQFDKGPKKSNDLLDWKDVREEIDDPLRWNCDLSAKFFDVTRERNPAVTKEIDLAAKYLDCEVKELTRRELVYHGTRMGAGLVALDEAIGAYDVEDVRNFARGTGEEAPLGHDVIRLNSKLRRSFLLDGTRFMRKTEGRLVCRVSPEWRGVAITVYGKGEHLADEFCEQVGTRAASLKFYKGESFSLSGEFLDATDETWDDVFLTEKNEKAFRTIIRLVNEHGAAMENRGLIALGEPGTGKTLATRVMRNETRGGVSQKECPHGVGLCTGGDCGKAKTVEPSTFIWISARDFFRMGAFGGIEHAFETAKDLAPTILVFEDVDNWIGRGEIDLLKTTMDGAARTKGIVTVLTTNDPAHFPTALIDRPGRFHDVLKVDLPDADQRTRMLARWAPDLSLDAAKAAVDGTDGYSGAHVRELAQFADIIREQDGIESPDEAIKLALVKVREQRDLIGETHAQQGRYVPRAAVVEAVKSALVEGVKSWERARIDEINRDASIKIANVRAAAQSADDSTLGGSLVGGKRICPKCDAANAPFAKTCKSCGASLRAGKQAIPMPSPDVDAALERAEEHLLASIGACQEAIQAALDVGDAEIALAVMEIQGELAEEAEELDELSPDEPDEPGPSDADLIGGALSARIAAVRLSVKDGRVLSATHYKKLKTAHAMVGEVIAAHDASRPVDPTAPAAPGQVPHVPAKLDASALARRITASLNEHEITESGAWLDDSTRHDALVSGIRERLAVHTSPGAAGR